MQPSVLRKVLTLCLLSQSIPDIGDCARKIEMRKIVGCYYPAAWNIQSSTPTVI